MRSKAGNSNRVLRMVTLPYRALIKARDYYIKSITDCGHPSVYARPVTGASSQAYGLPRSFSAQSYSSADSDDLRELIRANSTNNREITKAELELFIQQHLRQQRQPVAKSGVPRSVSVGIGMARIDEDEENCEEDVKVNKINEKFVYPRSKSYVVNNKFHV